MRVFIALCVWLQIFLPVSLCDEIDLPISVREFRDDSTYYTRILGAKKDIIKPTDDTIDSLISLWDKTYENYVKTLFDGFLLEFSGYLDSAKNRYQMCLKMGIKDKNIYYTNLDIARIYLKQGDVAKAERHLEGYLDTLFFEHIGHDLFWGGGTPMELIRFLDDHCLSFLQLAVRPRTIPVVSERNKLTYVLTDLKIYNSTFFAIPSYDVLEKSLMEAGEEIAGMIINKDAMGLMKYVDKYKWQVTFGEGANFGFEDVKRELSDSSSSKYCHLFGGNCPPGKSPKSIREYLMEAEGRNLRIRAEIFDSYDIRSPLGTLIYEWDNKPDFLYITDFPNPYFIYTKDGWKILSMFAK